MKMLLQRSTLLLGSFLIQRSCMAFPFSTSLSASQGTSGAEKTCLVPIADGSEELEGVTIVDTLVRAGVKVTLASVGPELSVTCSRGVKLTADVLIGDCSDKAYDAVVLPGGMPGATNLRESAALQAILKRHQGGGSLIGAICASPAVVLASLDMLKGKKATCYPAPKFQEMIPNLVTDEAVVVDEEGESRLITSCGPATALSFSLKIAELLSGKEVADEVYHLEKDPLLSGQ
ncbi:unnamed protein product [Chrysoparadoxa australica]